MNAIPSRTFSAAVDWLYADLMRTANPELAQEQGLGGQLLYAGELHEAGCALVVASNIAGAASFSATANAAAQKQALRDGTIDFLVTSLDEALRILKNELRKRQPIAVAVALPPEDVEREMLERGVRPDLLPPGTLDAARYEPFLAVGARQVNPVCAGEEDAVLTWSVHSSPALWLPRVDELLAESLDAGETAARRWLRYSSRYLGRRGLRFLRCRHISARRFLHRVQDAVARGEIETRIDISVTGGSRSEQHRFAPAGLDEAEPALGAKSEQQCPF